jgi:hypothetical protein
MYRAGLLLAALALTVAACSGSDSDATAITEPTATEPAATEPATTQPATTEPATTQPAPTTAPTDTEAPADETTTSVSKCRAIGDLADKTSGDLATNRSPLVGNNITATAKSCGEQVTIFVESGTDPSQAPAWAVGYVDGPVTDAITGESVDLAGEATLLFQMSSAMPNADGEGYSGPTDIVPVDVAHILELRQVANADGMTSWAIGLDAQYPFTAFIPDGPARLVIDIESGG